MAKKRGQRQQFGLQCPDCNSVNYVKQRNKTNTPDALSLKKYCNVCKKATLHKEKKKLD